MIEVLLLGKQVRSRLLLFLYLHVGEIAVRLFQSRYVRFGLIFALFAVLIAAGLLAYRNHQETAREAALKQVFAALQQYAEVSAGNYYPLRSAQEGVFLPDFDEWEKLAPDKASFERAREILTRTDGRPLCYLGYAFNKETFGLKILDRIESDAKSFRGGGPVAEGPEWVLLGSPEVDELHPLRKGVERSFIWDFVFEGLPPREGELEDRIPILWEIPEGEGDEVLVLNMSGYVRLRRYPGEFPLSPLFINRLRGMMELPQDPGFRDNAAIIPILREIMSVWDHQQSGWTASIQHFDVGPSVTAGTHKGYRIVVPEASMVLFPGEGEEPDFNPASFFYVENVNVGEVGFIDPGMYLGSGSGYHWYGSVSYQMQVLLRNRFRLRGGDSLYPVAVAQCRRHGTGFGPSPPRQFNVAELSSEFEEPKTFADYVHLYYAIRCHQNRPVSEEILSAGTILFSSWYYVSGEFVHPSQEIQREAQERLLIAAKTDPEAAAIFAMLYTLRRTHHGVHGGISSTGLDLLRQLPRDVVLRVVQDMASRIQRKDEAEACRRVLDELSRAPAVEGTDSLDDVDR